MAQEYWIGVKTGTIKYGGTDSDVYVRFIGTEGEINLLEVDDSHDNFERGDYESFTLWDEKDVGDLYAIEVKCDGGGWYLEYIQAQKAYGPVHRFSRRDWLDKTDEKDKQDQVIIYADDYQKDLKELSTSTRSVLYSHQVEINDNRHSSTTSTEDQKMFAEHSQANVRRFPVKNLPSIAPDVGSGSRLCRRPTSERRAHNNVM